MKKNIFIWYAVIMMTICFSVQTIISMRSLNNMNKENTEGYAKVMAGSIYDAINEKLLKPIMIGCTMADDALLIGMIESDKYTEEQKLEIFSAYLKNIVDRQNYSTAFLVYEPSRTYVTNLGFNKIVDPVNDAHDIWYSNFLDMGKEYALNIDSDQTLNDKWTLFVNCRINNSEGKILGVCGVGVNMQKLRYAISELQQKYGVHISLVDEHGAVKVDSDNVHFTEAILDIENIDVDENMYRYESSDNGYVMTRYMKNIGLYLVIQKSDNDISRSYLELISKMVLVMVVLLLLTILSVVYMIKKGYIEAGSEARTNGFSSIASIYLSMHEIDLVKNNSSKIKSTEFIDNFVKNEPGNASNEMYNVMSAVVDEEYKEDILRFTDLTTLADRIRGKRTLVHEFMGKNSGWCRARFIVEGNDLENVTTVILLIRVIDNEKKKEEKLVRDSTVDELTQCFNRKAYEDDIKIYNGDNVEDDLIYISADVNGLKVINDTIGHAAGDELIKGAAQCMKKCFGSYGKVYRTGGDEFIAIIFADGERLKEIESDIDYTVNSWCGNYVDSLTISFGYAAWAESPEKNIHELAKIADKRMYEAKALHYQRKGVDRRGQQAAFNAICASYTKILKVNLTEDSFNTIQVVEDERNEAMGYNEKISVWMHDFAISGQVHEDDRKMFLDTTSLEHLRNYFREGHAEYCIHYRRNINGMYREVMMEIIPANDYTNDMQIVYLYVKNIEKV